MHIVMSSNRHTYTKPMDANNLKLSNNITAIGSTIWSFSLLRLIVVDLRPTDYMRDKEEFANGYLSYDEYISASFRN